MQEILHLILLLQEGHRPDYVVFCDGVNDVYSAYKSGIAGTNHDYMTIKAKLERPAAPLIGDLLDVLKKHSFIFKAWIAVKNHLCSQGKHDYYEVAANYDDYQLRSLAHDIVDNYTKSIAFLDCLSKGFGFQYICLWQSTMFTEKRLTDEGRTVDVKLKDKASGALYTPY